MDENIKDRTLTGPCGSLKMGPCGSSKMGPCGVLKMGPCGSSKEGPMWESKDGTLAGQYVLVGFRLVGKIRTIQKFAPCKSSGISLKLQGKFDWSKTLISPCKTC